MGERTLGVAVLGATGRMGRQVVELVGQAADLELVAQVARNAGSGVVAVGPGCFGGADVVVDFSLPDGLRAALPHLQSAALVSGTTGLTADHEAALNERARHAAVLCATNFSLGVQLLGELVRRAAAAFPEGDVEVVETHHRHKVDSPSGTAITLAEEAARGRAATLSDHATFGRHGASGPRPLGEIGVHAVRGGDVVGDHAVHVLLDGERLTLTHQATSRATFAHGAVRAARWIGSQAPGRYRLSHVLGT